MVLFLYCTTFIYTYITYLIGIIGSKDKTGGTIDFPVIEVASNKGWDSGVVKRELKNLQWTTYDGPNNKCTSYYHIINIQLTVLVVP